MTTNTDETPDVTLGRLAGCAASPVTLPLTMLAWGFTWAVWWTWFVLPIWPTAPVITGATFTGIGLLVRSLPGLKPPRKDEPARPWHEIYLLQVLLFAFFWLIAGVARLLQLNGW